MDENLTKLTPFSRGLRELVSQRGGSVSRLSAASNVGRTTISAALNGTALPSRDSLTRILKAVDAEPEDSRQLLRLWEEARSDAEARRERRPELAFRSDIPLPQFGQPDPLTVATPAQLVEALRAVRIWAGSPSLRTLESRGRGRLSKSSVGAMLKSNDLPKYERFVAYLYACGIRDKNMDVWVFTWRRLKALQGPESQWMPGLTSAAASFG